MAVHGTSVLVAKGFEDNNAGISHRRARPERSRNREGHDICHRVNMKELTNGGMLGSVTMRDMTICPPGSAATGRSVLQGDLVGDVPGSSCSRRSLLRTGFFGAAAAGGIEAPSTTALAAGAWTDAPPPLEILRPRHQHTGAGGRRRDRTPSRSRPLDSVPLSVMAWLTRARHRAPPPRPSRFPRGERSGRDKRRSRPVRRKVPGWLIVRRRVAAPPRRGR